MKNIFDKDFFCKTLRAILAKQEPTKEIMLWDDERNTIVRASESKHLTPSGVKYNRLLRLHRRLSK